MGNLNVGHALWQLKKYGDREPLCTMIENGDIAVLENEKSRALIVKMLREGSTKRG